ncbi:MAG: DNA topoisomerase I [Candidatus Diapherotrites archaeon]
MKVIIAEKAIAGKSIAQILSNKTEKQSTIKEAQVFNFKWQDTECMVVPLKGHITDVDYPKKYSYWISTKLKELIDAPIEYKDKEKKIIEALKEIAKKATEVIVATDADREGESIGAEAIKYMKETNKELKVKRAYFSAITKKDLEQAFKDLKELDKNLADSADTRREIDLIWGAVLTRFLSIAAGKLGKEFLSVGRVQTPTLAIIVNREKERNAFKKRTYWEYKATLEKDKITFEAYHKKGKFWEKKETEIFKQKPTKATIKKTKKTEKTLKRPIPFNTTEFLRAATTIGFTAPQAMETAEYLYQQGYTSYPRTDNTTYPETLNLKEILKELEKVEDFKEITTKLLKEELKPSKGPKETKDHPPIHPVNAAQKKDLTEKQWKIYELICRRFFATLGKEAITENMSVEIDIAGEPFIANGQRIITLGWKEYYPYSQINEINLPKLNEGEEVKIISIELLEKETQPPARYSQAALIKAMEELNLGTKSTRHTIIQKLYQRNYVYGLKSIEPSKIAFAVIDSLEKYQVDAVKPDMTAELEKEMDAIAQGNKTKEEVVQESRKFLHQVLDRMIENKDKITYELKLGLMQDSIITKCPKCGNNMIIIWSKNKKRFIGCTNYPKCSNSYPLPQKGKISPLNKTCKECNSPMIALTINRRKLEMCLNYDCPTKEEWKQKMQNQQNAKKTEQQTNEQKKTT